MRIATILMMLIAAFQLVAQTPQQSYFEWTDLPFSKEELTQRRSNLLETLKREGKSGIVLIPARDGRSHGETFRQLDDFYYFTGLELPNSLLVMDTETNGVSIYVPEMDARFASASRPNDFPGRPLIDDLELPAKTGLTFRNISEFAGLLDRNAEAGRSILVNNGRLGKINYASNDYIAHYSPIQILLLAIQEKHPGLQHGNIYESIAKVRLIKSSAEIEVMRKTTLINIEGIRTAGKTIKPGIDERYLEGVLEGNYKVNGAQRLAFGSIIKSGPNSLWPWRILATHYNRRNRVMEEGELVIFDVGCEYNQYVSDVGRTFPVSGRFTDRQREILAMEVKVADQFIEYVKPGITFGDLKKLSEQIIPEDAKQYMQVGLFYGHHLGLSTGDPNLPEAPLQPGMIFTVEPWYYNHDEQLSVFTEDVILVTESGCEVLSKDLPRTPEAIEALMQE